MYDAMGGVVPAERTVVPSAAFVGARPGWIPGRNSVSSALGRGCEDVDKMVVYKKKRNWTRTVKDWTQEGEGRERRVEIDVHADVSARGNIEAEFGCVSGLCSTIE